MFLAHTSDLFQENYLVLEQYDKEKILIKDNSFHLISNICPHQGSLISMFHGSGNRICPYHSWSFDIKGNPLTSGRTAKTCKNTIPLKSFEVFEWSNLLFDKQLDFNQTIDCDNLILKEFRIDIVKTNYVNILDLFLDVDHIPSIHQNVYEKVGIQIDVVDWEFYKEGSIQRVKNNNAAWITVYPNTMIEWQNGHLFITVALPEINNQSKVLVYKYADKLSLDTFNINNDIWEIAWSQDKEQAERIKHVNNKNLEIQKILFRKYIQDHGVN